MSEKTWVYWVGLLIVAIAIVGLIGGAFGLMAPIPRLHFKTGAIAAFAPLAFRGAAMRLIGSVVFLITGIYMMIKGKAREGKLQTQTTSVK